MLVRPQFETKSCESLKKRREAVISQLEEMRKLKTERMKQFFEVLNQLQKISSELYGSVGVNAYIDENNLSLKKLQELHRQLLQLQNEKVIAVFTPVLYLFLEVFIDKQIVFRNAAI